jgi:O-antigen ligase
MRRAAFALATGVVLIGPTVLAFFAGGYFDGPRAAATAVAWAMVLGLALAGPLPLPRSGEGRAVLVGLAGLAVWSAISTAWAPLRDPVIDNVQRTLLYVGVLLVAIALLRDRRAARAVEPALALGALVVIAYGLSTHLLPGVVTVDGSFGAAGRLEQPITYWNAEGLLAALGLTLCIRVAGDMSRPALMRVAAAAGCAPLGLAVYLSYSRGALAVALIGSVLLLAFAPYWAQLRAALIGLGSGVVACAFAAVFNGVSSLHGAHGERDGAIMIVVLVLVGVAAALLTARLARAEQRGVAGVGPVSFARHLPAVAAAAAVLCAASLVLSGLFEHANLAERTGANPSRFASVRSARYEYWRTGVQAFADHPLQGVGSGGFRVVWREKRRVDVGATEVHSLVLEMATELGLPGLVLLTLLLGGVARAARRALRENAPLAAGAAAACSVWALHAAIDWDWQLPAVTLPAIILAGGLLAESERGRPSPPTPEDDAIVRQEEADDALVRVG